jgi:hypothetical protein
MQQALRLYVRGFENRVLGDHLIEALEDIGFQVKECFDGESDSQGGIIETYITPLDCLSVENPQQAVEAIEQSAGSVKGVFVQFDLWQELGGDHGNPDDGPMRYGSFESNDGNEPPTFRVVDGENPAAT